MFIIDFQLDTTLVRIISRSRSWIQNDHRSINQYCSIHSSYAINEKNISGKYTWKQRSVTNTDLRGLSFEKYYGKPVKDRDPIFVAIFFYCNILDEQNNNSEYENIC